MSEQRKMLHIQKTPPDEAQLILMSTLSQDYHCRYVSLFEKEDAAFDYGELIDLIFESDKIITWW